MTIVLSGETHPHSKQSKQESERQGLVMLFFFCIVHGTKPHKICGLHDFNGL